MSKLLFLLAPLLLTSCATLWNTLGVATEESVAARNAELSQQVGDLRTSIEDVATTAKEIANLRGDIDRLAPLAAEIDTQKAELQKLAASMDSVANGLADVAAVKKALSDLEGRLDKLPAETLRTIAALLTKAAQELP